MAVDVNTTLNQLEIRVTTLENNSLSATTGVNDILYDDETGTQSIVDRLDWSITDGWEPYATISPVSYADGDPPGGQLSSAYGRPEAYQIGRMCFLTGMARRKSGAAALSPGTRYNIKMFGLPVNLRPVTNVLLPCLIGNGDPATLSVVGTAWIEIRPEMSTQQPSAQVYYIAGNTTLNASTGWVALQGIFPCASALIGGDTPPARADSWNDAHFMTTWDKVNPYTTWDSYSSVD